MRSFSLTATAAQVVVECGPELYHMDAFRRENGDNATILHLSNHYQETENLTPADGAIRAGHLLKDIDSLKQGAFQFKQARKDVKRAKAGGGVGASHIGFSGA